MIGVDLAPLSPQETLEVIFSLIIGTNRRMKEIDKDLDRAAKYFSQIPTLDENLSCLRKACLRRKWFLVMQKEIAGARV